MKMEEEYKQELPSFSTSKSLKYIHSPSSYPKPSNSSPFTCIAIIFSPTRTTEFVPGKLHHLIILIWSLSQPIDLVRCLLHCTTLLSPLPNSFRVNSNQAMVYVGGTIR
ncbi:hypothetical protein POPTR_005G112150v4 [Populus trichocarpa]|uniref:Uncharacterized protein n=1 Tax=Populus trichocarpa TaxID=3694 RepID=A0ACC0SZ65_POPTR|nr:hypothetical protein POPTR_005G112150v4 [Populus trichocarpa]